LEDFAPIRTGEVRIYSCGPTVYGHVHIGNLRAFAFNDLLQRYLKFRGFKVVHVMNITDVDDKTIRDSRKANRSLKEFTEAYTAAFLEDLSTLKCEMPPVMPRATAEIPGMVEMIQKLLADGFAYKNDRGDIYFRISKDPHYGVIANIDLSQTKANASGRLALSDEYAKEDANDFALWKAWDQADGDVYWDTELGRGRPGWHIECSVMSAKYLGQPFDIHTGGIDLLFPHHTNEIAQSQCAYGCALANYWMHNAHLIVNGRKMSKSLGNFFTLRDLLDRGYSPAAIRYELLKTHYRAQLDFREDQMSHTSGLCGKYFDFWQRAHEYGAGSGVASFDNIMKTGREKFVAAMDDDLNISVGLAALHEWMGEINKVGPELNGVQAAQVTDYLQAMEGVLGFLEPPSTSASPEIDALVAERESARKSRNFARADEIRDILLRQGIVLKDGPQGTKWTRA
jgi:cysteinyl-tRNA synthetase